MQLKTKINMQQNKIKIPLLSESARNLEKLSMSLGGRFGAGSTST
jgi:hypothetical protein